MNQKKEKGNEAKNKMSGRGVQKFLLAVTSVYLVVFLVDGDLVWRGLEATGQTLLKILPIILLIFGIMVLSNSFLTPERVRKHFGHEAGWKGWLYAILFGILVAGPPYTLYPMLKQMKEQGLKTNYLAVFLYNRNVKIPLIPVMVYYFGWQFTIVMTILVIIFSIISGVMMEKITGE